MSLSLSPTQPLQDNVPPCVPWWDLRGLLTQLTPEALVSVCLARVDSTLPCACYVLLVLCCAFVACVL